MMLYVRTYHSLSMVNNSTKWVRVLCWIRRTELAQKSSNSLVVTPLDYYVRVLSAYYSNSAHELGVPGSLHSL